MSKIKLGLDVVKNLRNLADSLECLVGALETNETPTAAKEVEPEPKLIKPKPKQPTLEEVRAAMAEKNRAGHRDGVKEILRKRGAEKLTALDSAHYGAVLKEVGDLK